MPRFEGETFRFGTAMGCGFRVRPRPREPGTFGKLRRRAYRGSATRAPAWAGSQVGSQACGFCENTRVDPLGNGAAMATESERFGRRRGAGLGRRSAALA